MTFLPYSPVIPIDGLIAAAIVLLAGILLTVYFAGRAEEEPPVSFREMTRPIVRGAVALAALAVVGLVLLWFILAAFIADDGCAGVFGVIEGCLPR
jgi:hypothetical protein